MRILVVFTFAAAWLVAAAGPAYAYLDPGTGSIILQVLLGGIAGALVAGRLYWSRVKSFLGIGSQADAAPEKDAGAQEDHK